MLTRVTVVFGSLLSVAAAAANGLCDATIHPGTPCTCDVRTLQPLQGAVGMEEVRDLVALAVDQEAGEQVARTERYRRLSAGTGERRGPGHSAVRLRQLKPVQSRTWLDLARTSEELGDRDQHLVPAKYQAPDLLCQGRSSATGAEVTGKTLMKNYPQPRPPPRDRLRAAALASARR